MRAVQDQLIRPGGDRRGGRRRGFAAAVLAVTLVLASACTDGGGGKPSGWQKGGDQPPAPKAAATIVEPRADAKDVPASTGITFTATEARQTAVELKDSAGAPVEGELAADGKSWLPTGALKYAETYTATVTATGDDDRPATATSTFTTMAKPGKQVRVSSFLGDDQVVGVGMPLIVKFSRAIPEDHRDDVQSRMTVTSSPAQEGIWHWVSPTEIRYRPKQFWQANSTVSYRIQAGGLPLGDGWYGRADLNVGIKVGPAVVMTVDNKTKRMTVTKDGSVIKTIPVSLGKKSTPSSSGTMVVIEKLRKTVFDTFEELGPEEGYRTKIDYAQRLTWGGEFIHAAPWSEGQQGRVNVSHGCVNVSMANGAWLFTNTRVGDPITVKGTERKLQNGNGWTDWNMSWEQYVKGSALPYEPPAETAPEGTAEPTVTPTN
ncbi:Ig-like domain-containing protein [Micromonospora peucetia]|uniref:Ig-like domain-containing protein n=1 Tax=Micromonospora peucetia TaxID=47871 RepID=A0A1C6U9X8_9ACTN|nr:Ig-like domain-containing protein [Micromonospora peucetia]MCX4386362.1 Ig-like domain-containing protein [Micromonospora peucetia]WSA33704.1 Ig-like domain-containing protein [Micromonospora peucetia]SCL50900.1 Lipoprotein-anchoring transpeptidase ErfK/SrfK [Micromonospora peucetia]